MYREMKRGYEVSTVTGTLLAHVLYATDLLTWARGAPAGEMVVVALGVFDYDHLGAEMARDGQPKAIAVFKLKRGAK